MALVFPFLLLLLLLFFFLHFLYEKALAFVQQQNLSYPIILSDTLLLETPFNDRLHT